MINKTKLLLIICAFLMTFCTSKKNSSYYNSCMQKQLQGTGIDFYGSMRTIEDKMLEIGALDNKDRDGYLEAFQSLIIENEEKWDNYFNLLKKTVLSDFDLKSVELHVLSFCSDIKVTKEKTECDCLNIHKYFLKKLVNKSYDDDEVLDGLFLFTDFDNQTLRHNITYLLLLNLKAKYGQN